MSAERPERSLEALVGDLASLEKIVEGWDEPGHRQTVEALRTTLEDIQAGAFRRLIRSVKQSSPEGLSALRAAVEDPWVFNVLHYHGLLRPPETSLQERVEAALVSVRPTLAGHDGDVELVAVDPPEVRIRLLGTCDGCSFSEDTVRLGIEKAIFDAAAEITKVSVVQRRETLVQVDGLELSPFAQPFEDAGPREAVPDGGLRVVELAKESVLLTVRDGEVRAYPNACAHLGMPLQDGEVRDGVLTCPYHGFRYLLATGECLTAPDVQLPRYPVEIRDGRVFVQVRSR